MDAAENLAPNGQSVSGWQLLGRETKWDGFAVGRSHLPLWIFVAAYPFRNGLFHAPRTCSALSGITTARGLYVELFALRQKYLRPTSRAISVLGWFWPSRKRLSRLLNVTTS